MNKKCYRCKENKSLDDFANRTKYVFKYKGKEHIRYVDGKEVWCKDCERDYRRFFKYGINSEQYNKILLSQGEKCAICKTNQSELFKTGNAKYFPLVIDHSHKTNKVRGLLCHRCNRTLGLLKDDIFIIQEALNYLNNNLVGFSKLVEKIVPL